MNRRLLTSLQVVLLLLGCTASSGAASRHDYEVAGSPLKASPVDQQIAGALREVSVEKIKANIEALVGFKNRNTISSTESDLAAGPECWPRPTG